MPFNEVPWLVISGPADWVNRRHFCNRLLVFISIILDKKQLIPRGCFKLMQCVCLLFVYSFIPGPEDQK